MSKIVIDSDFNGDGKLDLAAPGSVSNDVRLLLARGDRTFQPSAIASTPMVGSTPVAIIAADLDQDGRLDLAVANQGSDSVGILWGNGDGSFSLMYSITTVVGGQPSALVAADFNKDGKVDLAAANLGTSAVTVLLNSGNRMFAKSSYITGGVMAPTLLAAADFSGNGNIDLAVASSSTGNFAILVGTGTGGFQLSTNSYSAGGSMPVAMIAGDFNGDRRPDLAIALKAGKEVRLFTGQGGALFGAGQVISLSPQVPTALTANDFDGDGVLDLAVLALNTTNQGIVRILRGDGNGGFPQDGPHISCGSMASFLVAQDFDGDQRVDVAVANTANDTVSINYSAAH